MNDDLLDRASRALRDAHDGSSDRQDETRARMMAELSRTPGHRGRWPLIVVPLAAALAASAVWAGATGRLSAAWHSLAESSHQAPPDTRTELPAATHLAFPALSAEAPPPAVAPPADDSAPAIAVAAPEKGVALHPGPAAASSSPEPAPDADQAAYLTAHRKHFGGASPSEALNAWNDYLRTFPNGRFALEARFNRAVSLVRLGRAADARAALEPFASGRYGNYRRAEAQRLVDALSPAANPQ